MIERWFGVLSNNRGLRDLMPDRSDIITRLGTVFQGPAVIRNVWICLFAVFATAALPTTALADSLVVSVGNTAPTNPFDGGAPLVSGNVYGSAVYSSNFVAPFFTDFCGNEIAPTGGVNCDKSWTFNYTIPAGQTITAASLTLGIADIDSASSGNQVSLYQISGGDVLTGILNTAAEALHGGTGSVNAEYDVFTLPLSNFAALSGGSATVHLTLQGPAAAGLFGISDTNGAYVISSSLNITTQAPSAVPEPGSLALFASAIGALAGRRLLAGRS